MVGIPAHKVLESAASPTLPDDRMAELTADRLIHFTKTLRAEAAQDNHGGFADFNRNMRLGGRWFLAGDFIALATAYVVGTILIAFHSLWIKHEATSVFSDITTGNLTQMTMSFGFGLLAILWLDTKGHYRQRLPSWETLGHFAKVTLIGFICGGFLQYAIKDNYSRLQLGLFWVLFGSFMLGGRALVRQTLARRGSWHIKALIIGNKASARAIARALESEPAMGFSIAEPLSPELLSSMLDATRWKQLLTLYEAQHVFVALEGGEMQNHHSAIQAMVRARIPHSIVPPWLGLPSSNVSPHHFIMHDVFILQNASRLSMPLPRLFKRSFDLAMSAAALTLLAPVFAFVTLMVRRDGGPAFFSQPRVGRNGKPFPCYKFRSMRVDAEESLQHYLNETPAAAEEWAHFQKLKDDVRVTPFGRFLRRTSIDELPQLINVLKGDMSLVGPRPITQGQEEFYAEDFCFYESVRPGITGPWQVSGRSQLTFKERVALESWYARNWNLWTDIVIILKTFPALLKRGQAV